MGHMSEADYIAEQDAQQGYDENQYTQRCEVCGGNVKPGEGWVRVDGDGAWACWHKHGDDCDFTHMSAWVQEQKVFLTTLLVIGALIVMTLLG